MDFPQRVNGWALYAHPCFQETYDALVAEVETLKGKDPENYQRKAATKLLAVVHKVIEEHITVNPSSPAFRHGKSLGSGKNKDWSRVKFGAGRYWICPYISRHLLSLNPLLACCRRYSRGER